MRRPLVLNRFAVASAALQTRDYGGHCDTATMAHPTLVRRDELESDDSASGNISVLLRCWFEVNATELGIAGSRLLQDVSRHLPT